MLILDLGVCFCFKSPVAERLFNAADGVGMDGTFYERGPFSQLFILRAHLNGTSLPIAWCYMEKRTKEDYVALFSALFSQMPLRWFGPEYAIAGTWFSS